ncbi:hypothetical protein COCVIDRAFT_16506 [Bipolaris victoriae FI3]|uniref:Uncharacterized protein n=1 Tax=Bipolaris victoriae (strain FI3) TaxID=930091 RepID=W7E7N6_BIPV3|nr:hypothetical protein COCVIDRAFT_16506 [Bipolaris victoriae FI3]
MHFIFSVGVVESVCSYGAHMGFFSGSKHPWQNGEIVVLHLYYCKDTEPRCGICSKATPSRSEENVPIVANRRVTGGCPLKPQGRVHQAWVVISWKLGLLQAVMCFQHQTTAVESCDLRRKREGRRVWSSGPQDRSADTALKDAQGEVPGGGKTAVHPQNGTTTAARGSAPTPTKKEIAIVFWAMKAGSEKPDSQPLERRTPPQGFCQRPLLQVLGPFAPPSTWADSQRYQVKIQVQAFANPFDLCPVGCGCDYAFVQSLGTLHDQH